MSRVKRRAVIVAAALVGVAAAGFPAWASTSTHAQHVAHMRHVAHARLNAKPKPTPTPTATATATSAATVGIPSAPTGPTSSTGWTTAFSDGFDGTALDTSKWTAETGRSMNNVSTGASNVSVTNGKLRIQLSTDSSGTTTGGLIETDPCGSCTTPGRFNFKVGQVLQAYVYLPGGCAAGATSCGEDIYDWPGSVWTAGHTWPDDGEYDLDEGLGGDATINYHHGSGTDIASNGSPSPSCCYGNEWHAITLERGVNTSQVWFDGALMRTITAADTGAPQSILINLGKSNSRTVHTGESGAIYVDYVAVFQRA